MLLHLIQDDLVFTDFVIEIFNTVAPNQNIYLLSNETHDHNIKYIRNISQIKYAPCGTNEFLSFFDKTKIKAVIIHGMTKQAAEAIIKFGDDIHFHWMCTGYDLYGTYDELNSCLLQPETKKVFRNNHSLGLLTDFLKRTIHKTTGIEMGHKQLFKSAMNKVKSCSMIIDEDFNLFKMLSGSKAKHVPFNYDYLENLVPINLEPYNQGQHILLGNSSSWTNNHLDAFPLLKDLHLYRADIKVYTPLSYGDEAYKKIIAIKGKTILGDQFVPMAEFLPLNEYTEILKKCSVAIMNHNRQQALGNIVLLIWLGMRLYLQESNPVSQFLKRLGIIYFKLNEDFDLTKPQTLQPLSNNEVLANRKALKNHYGKDVVFQRIKHLCEYLMH